MHAAYCWLRQRQLRHGRHGLSSQIIETEAMASCLFVPTPPCRLMPSAVSSWRQSWRACCTTSREWHGSWTSSNSRRRQRGQQGSSACPSACQCAAVVLPHVCMRFLSWITVMRNRFGKTPAVNIPASQVAEDTSALAASPNSCGGRHPQGPAMHCACAGNRPPGGKGSQVGGGGREKEGV